MIFNHSQIFTYASSKTKIYIIVSIYKGILGRADEWDRKEGRKERGIDAINNSMKSAMWFLIGAFTAFGICFLS